MGGSLKSEMIVWQVIFGETPVRIKSHPKIEIRSSMCHIPLTPLAISETSQKLLRNSQETVNLPRTLQHLTLGRNFDWPLQQVKLPQLRVTWQCGGWDGQCAVVIPIAIPL